MSPATRTASPRCLAANSPNLVNTIGRSASACERITGRDNAGVPVRHSARFAFFSSGTAGALRLRVLQECTRRTPPPGTASASARRPFPTSEYGTITNVAPSIFFASALAQRQPPPARRDARALAPAPRPRVGKPRAPATSPRLLPGAAQGRGHENQHRPLLAVARRDGDRLHGLPGPSGRRSGCARSPPREPNASKRNMASRTSAGIFVKTVHLGGRRVLDGEARRGYRRRRHAFDSEIPVGFRARPTPRRASSSSSSSSFAPRVRLSAFNSRAADPARRDRPRPFRRDCLSLRLPHLPHPSPRVPRERLLDGDHRLQRARRDGRRRRQLHRQPRADLSARARRAVPVREAPAPGDLVEGGTGDGLQRAHELGIEESRGQNHEHSARVQGQRQLDAHGRARTSSRGLKVPTRRRIRRARRARGGGSPIGGKRRVDQSARGKRVRDPHPDGRPRRAGPARRARGTGKARPEARLGAVVGFGPGGATTVRAVRRVRHPRPLAVRLQRLRRGGARGAGVVEHTTPRRRIVSDLKSIVFSSAQIRSDSVGRSPRRSPRHAACALFARLLPALADSVCLFRGALGDRRRRTADARGSLNGALDSGFGLPSRDR